MSQLRDAFGNMLGRTETRNGQEVAIDAFGVLKGTYDPKTDQTKDASGRLIGQGNQVAGLLVKH